MPDETYDGATTALQRRIEELAAELQKEKDRRVEVRRSNQDLNEVVHALTKDLATERAAREDWHRLADERSKALIEERAAREQAVFLREHMQRERDTALAALEGANSDCERYGDNWMRVVKRANAAEARVKDLEDRLTAAELSEKRLEAGKEVLLSQWETADSLRRAAETALASAWTVISLFAPASAVARAWLTSHPAPVAAPSCGRAWCKPDNRCADCTPQCTVCGRWSGHCGCVVPAPVAFLPPVSESDEAMVSLHNRYENALNTIQTAVERISCCMPAGAADDAIRIIEECRAGLHQDPVAAPCAGCELTRWSPCEVDAEDADGPVYQGFLSDPDGEWVKWEDVDTKLGLVRNILRTDGIYRDVIAKALEVLR